MRFEEINIGLKAEFEHKITEEDVQKFTDLTGDNNRLHIDKEYAAQTPFKKPVAHGMLSASFISTMIGTRIPGQGALWLKQDLEFLLPVRVGDKLRITAEVIGLSERDKTIKLSTIIYNQKKQKVISGSALVQATETLEKKKATTTINAKTAIIIGASGEIGSAVARQLHKEGYTLALHYYSNESVVKELLNGFENKNNAFSVKGDIANPESVKNMIRQVVDRFGSISAAVNCATLPLDRMKFEDITWTEMDHQLNNQVKGAFNVVKELYPFMKINKYGKIVHITTVAIDQQVPGMMSYITAKSGLSGMLKSMALEMAPHGIRLNMVAPGFLDTQLNMDISEKAKMLIAAKTPLKRLGNIEEVAAAVTYLVKPESDYLTGETIRVNGGQVMI